MRSSCPAHAYWIFRLKTLLNKLIKPWLFHISHSLFQNIETWHIHTKIMKTFQDPIWEEASISSHKGSKKSKKSTFILGGIIGLLVLIQIVFSILNMIENSTLKAKLESEAENAKTMEAKLNNFQSQLESEAENAKSFSLRLCPSSMSNSIFLLNFYIGYRILSVG